MADEFSLQFDVAGPPDFVMDEWRRQPPRTLVEDGYKLSDESYNSLTWERQYLDWPMKLIIVTTFGLALLFRSFMVSVFKVTARFDEQGAGTRVLLAGTAHPRNRAAFAELAADSGGTTGPPTPSAASTLLPGSPPS